MNAQLETAKATATTLGLPSRVMASARERHFFIDGTSKRDGLLPEAPTAGDTFLASLAGCAAIIVNSEARLRGLKPFKATFSAVAARDPAVPNHFVYIEMEAMVEGTSQEEAEELVRMYQDQCPIYGLAAAATKVTMNVKAVS